MSTQYHIQINSNKSHSEALLGRLQIKLIGSNGRSDWFSIKNEQAIFSDYPILASLTLAPSDSIGFLTQVEVNYLGLQQEQRWYLNSLEVSFNHGRNYLFFDYRQWLVSEQANEIPPIAIKSRGKFEVFQGKDKQFYFHLKAANGEIIAASEGYTTRQSALHGIQSIRENAETAQIIELNKKAS